MSNAQMQTRGMSAGDFVRMKRLAAQRKYYTSTQTSFGDSVVGSNKDIHTSPAAQLAYTVPMHHFKTVGTSKIRRPASEWTAFKASQTMDFPSLSGRVVPFATPGTVQAMTRLCDCSNSALETKVAGCASCAYNPIENYTKPSLYFEEIQLNNEYSGTLTGDHVCPTPSDFTNYYKLYKIKFNDAGSYTFQLNCITGDQDLALSYPNTDFGEKGIITFMEYDFCGPANMDQYFQNFETNGGGETIVQSYNAGDTIYILILSYDAGDFTFSVTPSV